MKPIRPIVAPPIEAPSTICIGCGRTEIPADLETVTWRVRSPRYGFGLCSPCHTPINVIKYNRRLSQAILKERGAA